MYAEFSFSTSKKQEIIDINNKVQEIVSNSGVKEGICTVFAKHATAAIIINENYDANMCLDLIDALNEIIPKGKWRHDKIDGNADAHIKAAILGPSETIPIKNNKLELGRWQSLMFCEFDGPRSGRTVAVNVMRK